MNAKKVTASISLKFDKLTTSKYFLDLRHFRQISWQHCNSKDDITNTTDSMGLSYQSLVLLNFIQQAPSYSLSFLLQAWSMQSGVPNPARI